MSWCPGHAEANPRLHRASHSGRSGHARAPNSQGSGKVGDSRQRPGRKDLPEGLGLASLCGHGESREKHPEGLSQGAFKNTYEEVRASSTGTVEPRSLTKRIGADGTLGRPASGTFQRPFLARNSASCPKPRLRPAQAGCPTSSRRSVRGHTHAHTRLEPGPLGLVQGRVP